MDTWFVLYCKRGKDTLAQRNLVAQDFEVYRPLIRIAKVGGNHGSRVRLESFFPRYLFVKVDLEMQALSPIRSTRGVSGFVKFGDKYSSVNSSVIEEIRACELEKQRELDRKSAFVKGDVVYINGACFSDFQGIFCEMRGDERVMVLLNILGRMSEVEIPQRYVSKVKHF